MTGKIIKRLSNYYIRPYSDCIQIVFDKVPEGYESDVFVEIPRVATIDKGQLEEEKRAEFMLVMAQAYKNLVEV